jgi:hypothetical protein
MWDNILIHIGVHHTIFEAMSGHMCHQPVTQ